MPPSVLRTSTGVSLCFLYMTVLSHSLLLLLYTPTAIAKQPIQFDSGFMQQSTANSSHAGAQALAALGYIDDLGPGRYWVHVTINQTLVGQRELDFSLSPDNQTLLACLSSNLLKEIGVKLDAVAEPQLLQQPCVNLEALIPDAKVQFEGDQLRLNLSIPQIAMHRDVAGYVEPTRWDSGINAAFLSYQASAQQGYNRFSGSSNQYDLYLNTGVNLREWRLRSNLSRRQQENGDMRWSSAYTYAQRDLPGTWGNLTLGETFTSGDVMRSVPFTGAVIATDPGMLPDVLQGYAPIIRGFAQTRAKLEVLQNGYPIYSTYVSPGAYEINDLSTAGGSGELEIVLTEADGSVRRFTQPYATLGNLLREDVWRYSLALGRYKSATNLEQPMFWQGTLAKGIGWGSTVYGGALSSSFYQAGSLGIAKDLGSIGALALDVTHSRSDTDSHSPTRTQGQSYAVKYGKSFQTNTHLRFAGYRYSTQGYRDFEETLRERSHDRYFLGSRRSRLEASIYQNIGRSSTVNLSFSHQDYWGASYVQRQFQLTLSTQHKGLTYNLSASQSLSDRALDNDRQISLGISFPLDVGLPGHATLSADSSGGYQSQRANFSGSTHENRLSYRASLANSQSDEQSASLGVGYQSAYGNLGGGITQGNHYRSVSINSGGAVLLHADGVEVGPYLGETMALIEVLDTPGVGLLNATGVETNARGYALMPYLRPYRVNAVLLQTDNLGPEVELENGITQVVPRRGAVVKAAFTSRKVTRILINSYTRDGEPLPFGAQAVDAQGEVIATVGQGGQLLLSTHDQPQTLYMRWGHHIKPQCELTVAPQQMQIRDGYRLQTLTCQ
ncbi:fimbria/pilus outer membrane usher protein [Pseudomonas sp. SIMBA_077]